MLRKLEEKLGVVVVEGEPSVALERQRTKARGVKQITGRKELVTGKVTRYKSRVIPCCLALFGRHTCLIQQGGTSHGGIDQGIPARLANSDASERG